MHFDTRQMIASFKLNRSIKILVVFLLLGTAGFVFSVPRTTRIVAIGDVHGAYEAFFSILRESQLINEKQQWTAGNTILVQTGDILDRGPASRKAMELVMALEKEGPKKGGKVVALLGNHEVMNIIGDLRYVSAEEYASYIDSGSVKKQETAYRTYEVFIKQRAKKLNKASPVFTKEAEADWKRKHPAGYIEHREAFGPNGKYGKWLRRLDAVRSIEGNIFLHGGISERVSEFSIDEINRRIHEEIRTFDNCSEQLQTRKAIQAFFTLDEILEASRDEFSLLTKKSKDDKDSSIAELLKECVNMDSWLIIHPEGPLWFRGFSTWTDAEGPEQIQKLLEKYKVARFITAHSVQPEGKIHSRFGGKIILIDTGMLSSNYPGGQASALEISNGTITAIYIGKREPILTP